MKKYLFLGLNKSSAAEPEAPKAFVSQLSMWSRHLDSLAQLHLFEVLSHCTAFREFRVHVLPVYFDQEIDEGGIVDRRDWCIRAFFFLTIDGRMKHHVLSDWQAEAHVDVWELESEDKGVLGDLNLRLQFQTDLAILVLFHVLQRAILGLRTE